jgi:hypothetical protein
MQYDEQTLARIWRGTSGYCHICHKKLAYKNYGQEGKRGAWEVEHSLPRALGGTDHLNNLKPACIGCNRNKGIQMTRTARGWNGKARAPLPPDKRRQAELENGILGAFCGGVLGLVAAGPFGAVLGILTGGHLASGNPDK